MEPRAWASGANASPPAVPGTPSIGYPSGGVPGVSPKTVPGAYWYHQVAEELRAVIVAGGQVPSQGTLNQLLTALQSLFAKPFTTAGVPFGFRVGPMIVFFGTDTTVTPNQGDGPTVTFPTVPGAGSAGFPTACVWANVSTLNPSSDLTADGWIEIRSWTATQLLTHNAVGTTTATEASRGFTWIAIGY